MSTSEIQATIIAPSGATAGGATPTAAHHAFTFHDFLSAMNPLQYLPVVGTIYRAVTGDVIPESIREAGSLLFSGLLGGPIGLITSIAATIAEKITGIDPEKIVTALFHSTPTAPAVSAAAVSTDLPPAATTITAAVAAPAETQVVAAASAAAAIAPAAAVSPQLALTPQQLAAYGVRSDVSGNLRLGDIQGADVLNSIQLVRLSSAAAAYAANQSLPPAIATQGN